MKLKLLRETLLLIIFFPLKSEKEVKMDEATLFETARGFLTCLLTLRPRIHIYVVFWTALVLAIFWPVSVAFRT